MIQQLNPSNLKYLEGEKTMEKKDENSYLRIERDNMSETVSILGNKKGLECLKNCIEALLDNRTQAPEDISLMAPSWGGEELVEDDGPSKNCSNIGHLRIYRCE
jgi:hypothetical protein